MKVKLGKALEYEQPSKYIVESEKYKNEYKTPVLTAGKSFILGYTNETTGIYNNLPVIIFDDFTTDVKFVDFPFKVKSSAMKMLQPSSNEYNLKYFYYLIKFLNFQPTSHQRHWISKFAEFEFNIPDRQKQDEIVEKLDKMAEILSLKDKELKKYDELIKSQFSEMFGNPLKNEKFPIKDLNEICDVRDGTHDSPKYHHAGYPLITSKNIINGEISFDDINLISKEDYNKINQRSYVDDGDILMPMIGTIGNPAIVKRHRDFAIKNVALIKFHTNSKVINQFILYAMKSDEFNSYLKEKNKGGTQKFVSLGIIRKTQMIVPPLELQNQFATFVKHFDKLKFSIKQSIEKLENCYNSLMQEYFN